MILRRSKHHGTHNEVTEINSLHPLPIPSASSHPGGGIVLAQSLTQHKAQYFFFTKLVPGPAAAAPLTGSFRRGICISHRMGFNSAKIYSEH